MDGCPAETTGLSGRWLGSDQYGIGALKEAAACVLTEDTSLTLLSSRMESKLASDTLSETLPPIPFAPYR